MIVRKQDVGDVIAKLSKAGRKAFDTETTGLYPWQGDRLFSLIIYDGEQPFYFNFKKYEGLFPEWVLPRRVLNDLKAIFENPEQFWYAHNAKFDMAMLKVEGINIAGTIHCTEVHGRLVDNTLFTYTLDHLAGKLGHKKDDAVKNYLKENKLYRLEKNNLDEEIKIPRYDAVPFEIMSKYGQKDAEITYKLGEWQRQELHRMSIATTGKRAVVDNIIVNERAMTKIFSQMEQTGIRVDVEYSKRAASHEFLRAEALKSDWFKVTGLPFVDSAKSLEPCFIKAGEPYPKTEKGNPSFTADVLEGMKSPLAKMVLDYRNASKRCNTYFKNFVRFADDEGILHANIRQAGTATGRLSYSEPNLQNLSKGADRGAEFPIRRAFIPRADHAFVMIDFDQMEYRLMLDYAEEQGVIDLVLSGVDVHTATAQMMSTESRAVSRDEAKTINFMLLYGGGVAKLAMALFPTKLPEKDLKRVYEAINFWSRMTIAEQRAFAEIDTSLVEHDKPYLQKAQELRELYFEKLPKVRRFIKSVQNRAVETKRIVNWAGRMYQFPVPEATFKAPNYLIQGGCADIVKLGMNSLAKRLAGTKSKMLVQIHDEVLFEVHKSELAIIPDLKEILEKIYCAKNLPLTCGVDHSWVSWADKVEGLPC
jgi:DNA polymerase-1